MIESPELDTLNIINDLDDFSGQTNLEIKVVNQDYEPYFTQGEKLKLNLVTQPQEGDWVVVVYEDVDYIKSPEGRFVRRAFVNRIVGQYSVNPSKNQYNIKNISKNEKQPVCIEQEGMYRNRIAGILIKDL